MIILTDKTGSANCISFYSYKCGQVIRSVLGEQRCGSTHCLDMAYISRSGMEKSIKSRIPLTVLTNLESFLKIIVKSSTKTKKHLMIDVNAAREAFEKHKHDNVAWIRRDITSRSVLQE